MKHRLGRSQKYHRRPRILYALMFASGYCYIGQTVDLRQREAQHRSPRGGWRHDFEVVELATVHATEAEASDFERAWRLAAVSRGWRVYAKPPGIPCNPRLQARLKHVLLSWRLRWRWPIGHSRSIFWRLIDHLRHIA